MGFERKCLDQVKHDVSVKHQENIEPWFEYGTMWCNDISEDVASTIQHSIINFCEKPGTSVSKSEMDQSRPCHYGMYRDWAFDIIGEKNAL
ncbi:uncharacterized protein METZ01_LOCUS272625 [marine metagenome]|uniref:Uncharacterized protein n=1 Tax=marine metagenome TaxID=408172 RepID=A0A382KAL0_9ZZZZ